MNESWSQPENLDNYEVSNEGRVRNSKTGKILKPSIDGKGYETVTVKENGRLITKRVGKLVASAFIKPDPDRPNIGYKDGNRKNNSAENIFRKRRSKKIMVIETNEIYDSISECSKATGISPATISRCCNYSFYTNKQNYHFKVID